jgi:predicted TIM-barrel fold metal-dependent hydrolase
MAIVETMAIIDAHHHLIDTHRLRYPWIDEPKPALTALLTNYYDIAHDYDVRSYLADVGKDRPAAAVACEFGAADGLAEARTIQQCADELGWPSAFIAAVDLTSPMLDQTLAAYQELPVVRGVRQPLYWADDPLRRLGARPDFLTDATWLRGFESVAATGLTWDLLIYDEQSPAAEELLRSFPNTRIVLEAVGWPLDQGSDGFRRWEERLRVVAEHPQVTVKMQGLALIFGPDRNRIETWVRTALEIFGARRCMFASHFPVDRLLWSWEEMLAVMQAICDWLSEDDKDEFFAGCARREYRLSD